MAKPRHTLTFKIGLKFIKKAPSKLASNRVAYKKGRLSTRQQNASRMAFCWLTDRGPILYSGWEPIFDAKPMHAGLDGVYRSAILAIFLFDPPKVTFSDFFYLKFNNFLHKM